MDRPRYLRAGGRFPEIILLTGCVLLSGLRHGVCKDFTTVSGTDLSRLIHLRPELREISRQIRDHGLEDVFSQQNLTVFLPDNEAMARFQHNQLGYDYNNNETIRELLLYHSVNGVIYGNQIQNELKMKSRTAKPTILYFNTFTYYGDTIYTVNGARLLLSNIKADNGVIHVIDKVMAPFGSDKSIVEYDYKPDLPHLSFTSITAVSEINNGLFLQANRSDNFFTVFSPNDSYTYPIPERAQTRFYSDWKLINDTIKAHIIPNKVICMPAHGNLPDVTSLNGNMKFTRRDGKVYVENNRVRAEVIIPNIPLRNGVLHVINNLLYFIYDNVFQKVARLYQASIFQNVTSRVSAFTRLLQSPDTPVTLFVPVDMAFAKLPTTKQDELQRSPALLAQVLNSHIIVGHDLDLDTLSQMGNVQTLGNRDLRVVRMNNDVYIQHGGQRSKVVEANIGCTNGIIHLINDVLIDHSSSIWVNIENQAELSTVRTLLSNHVDIRTTLSSDDTQLTVFLPSSAFLAGLPSYSQETLQAGGSRIHEALKGHIAVDTLVSSSDLKDGVERKLTTKDGGSLYVTKHGHEIFVNGSHVIGKVTVSDIWCSNGIIHILDNILHIPTRNALDELKRHDITGLASNMFAAGSDVRHLLENSTARITLFVPSDNGITKIPNSRSEILHIDVDMLNKFLRAHILKGDSIFTREISEVGETFPAGEGDIHVIKSRDDVFVKNNGITAKIIRANIPVTNGVIHVIDGAVWFAYQTVEEVLATHPDVTPFYSLISRLPRAVSVIQSGKPMTIFAPSSRYISNLASEIQDLTEDGDFLTKIFSGHTMPGVILNTTYLDQQSSRWQITTENNVTFHFKNEFQGRFFVAIYKAYDIVPTRSAIQCTDGMIYVIEEFLNYSPYTTLEVVQGEPNLRQVFNVMISRIKPLRDILTREHRSYTVLAPDDVVAQTQLADMTAFYQDSKQWDSVIWRHIILDGMIRLGDLATGDVDTNFTRNGIKFSRERDDVYVTWGSLRARVVRSDILTSNGIIHVIDKLFYERDLSNVPTTATRDKVESTTAGARTGKSTNTSNGSTNMVVLVCMVALSQVSWIVVTILRV